MPPGRTSALPPVESTDEIDWTITVADDALRTAENEVAHEFEV